MSHSSEQKTSDSFADIVQKKYSRRRFLQHGLLSGAVMSLPIRASAIETLTKGNTVKPSFNFTGLNHGISDTHLVAQDYKAEILLKWGEPIFLNGPAFNVNHQSPIKQEQQFGYNNDYIGYLPLPKKQNQQHRALLCINHEYAEPYMMFPELVSSAPIKLNKEHVEIMQSAVGNSIVEVEQINGKWRVVKDSTYNRRITARTTKMQITGPVTGHARVKTQQDPKGENVIGTLMNCAGGMTPWGTYLTCEENFNNVFTGSLDKSHPEYQNHHEYGVNGCTDGWGILDKRFNINTEPHEPNRFGWVVEIDPMDPQSIPKKRTALGRTKHEGAECVVSKDGRLVVYMGDDQKFQYLYKFVSQNKVNSNDKSANQNLLDTGILYVARFFENNEVHWLPLVFGQGPLTTNNGFASQADVLIETRKAATLLDATPMDRPEDVVPNPHTGKVYVILTNNNLREADQVNVVNPRANNQFGQIVELIEPDGEFSATQSKWTMLLQAGNPEDPNVKAMWNKHTDKNAWFTCPDNGVIDHQGRLWVGTDQGASMIDKTGNNDGLWAVETEGELRGLAKMLFRGPRGAEVSGPQFSEDDKALFLSVQHPGTDDAGIANNNVLKPTTRWPDFDPLQPARSAVVVVQHKKGRTIG